MQKMKCVAMAVTALFALGLGSAHAQFVDSAKPAEITTVKTVLKDGKDDQWVVLEGKIIERIKGDDYRFQDKTGTIEVDIDDDVFKGQKVTPETIVRIEGEVDTEMVGDNKIDVERMTIVK